MREGIAFHKPFIKRIEHNEVVFGISDGRTPQSRAYPTEVKEGYRIVIPPAPDTSRKYPMRWPTLRDADDAQ